MHKSYAHRACSAGKCQNYSLGCTPLRNLAVTAARKCARTPGWEGSPRARNRRMPAGSHEPAGSSRRGDRRLDERAGARHSGRIARTATTRPPRRRPPNWPVRQPSTRRSHPWRGAATPPPGTALPTTRQRQGTTGRGPHRHHPIRLPRAVLRRDDLRQQRVPPSVARPEHRQSRAGPPATAAAGRTAGARMTTKSPAGPAELRATPPPRLPPPSRRCCCGSPPNAPPGRCYAITGPSISPTAASCTPRVLPHPASTCC